MMKQPILFLLILFIRANFSQAQDKNTKKVGGIRGGFHLATMVANGSKPDTVNNLKSFYVGIFRDNKIASILHFGTSLEYFQNGMKYSRNVERKLHTLSISLYLKVKLRPVFTLGGAAPNFKLKEKVDYQDNSYNPADTDTTKGFDVAAFLGAGVKILFIAVEGRYHWGLLEARDELYNRYFQRGAAISF
jgi:hypothetical protein